MGMIRVSDHAEQTIKDFATKMGVTNTTAVDVLLASDTTVAASTINKRLDDLAVYLEKKFAELYSLVEDTTIDRLSGSSHSGSRPRGSSPTYLDWPIVQELMYDWAEDGDWTSSAARQGMEESNLADEAKWYIDEGSQGVWGEFYGEKQKYLNLTSHVLSFLNEKGIVL